MKVRMSLTGKVIIGQRLGEGEGEQSSGKVRSRSE